MAFYSAFWGQAFWNQAFQIARSDSPAPVVEETRGGVADYKKYQKQLHAIAKAADKRLFNKIEKKINKLAVNAPAPIVEVVEQIKAQIDFAELANIQSQVMAEQLSILLKKLDKLVVEALLIERQREDEEELILIMAAL